jgi:hypothetical protein
VIKTLRSLLLFYALYSLPCHAFGQTVNDALPAHVINRLFEGMQKGDSAIVHNTFATHVTLATIYRSNENESTIKHEDSIKDFLIAVGTPHKDTWYEEIWEVKVEVDGDLAQAWCEYAFFVNDTFSHCGVDAFHLHREKDGWKIFHLTDTRRKGDCHVPESIKVKHHQD